MSNYESQLNEAERINARWWGAFRELVIEIGAKLEYTGTDSVDIKLPEGWTQGSV